MSMLNKNKIHHKILLSEIKTIPPEYFPNLLQMIRVFRETILFSAAARNMQEKKQKRYPLRGIPFTYIDPTESVALDDWEALQ